MILIPELVENVLLVLSGLYLGMGFTALLAAASHRDQQEEAYQSGFREGSRRRGLVAW